LNAYWPEVKDEAEFVYHVAWDRIKYADMHHKGIQLIYKYEEGKDLDFDMGLYFYEQLCKYCEDPKNKDWLKYKRSQPEMMTAIKRKQELREKVDVNFDGRVSFLEYLLYQYKDVANPADFCKRSMAGGDEHPEIRKARLALEEANKAIKAYEEEKARLEEGSKEPGVKGLKFKNMLAQLDASPLWEAINKALITAEAAVRIAVKKFGGARGAGAAGAGGADDGSNSEGALWWMQTELAEKKVRPAAALQSSVTDRVSLFSLRRPSTDPRPSDERQPTDARASEIQVKKNAEIPTQL
jgi:hypothetical protein